MHGTTPLLALLGGAWATALGVSLDIAWPVVALVLVVTTGAAAVARVRGVLQPATVSAEPAAHAEVVAR